MLIFSAFVRIRKCTKKCCGVFSNLHISDDIGYISLHRNLQTHSLEALLGIEYNKILNPNTTLYKHTVTVTSFSS